MKKEAEPSVKELIAEEAELIAYILENQEIFFDYTTFRRTQLEWIIETFRNLTPEGREASKYASYKLSPKKRKELEKDKDRFKNNKSRIKSRTSKMAIDLSTVAWIHRIYSDDALEEMYPKSAIEHVVKTLVFRFGYDYAVVLASAIESGMALSQMAYLPEYPDIFEFSVPVTVRVNPETTGKMSMEIWRKAFERLAEKRSEKGE
jgi:hypothetical protein